MDNRNKPVEVTEYVFEVTRNDLPKIAKYIEARQNNKLCDLEFLHDLNTVKRTYIEDPDKK